MHISFWCLAALAAFPVFTMTLSQDQRLDVETGNDPGPCNKDNHGKLKLVKNREDDDRLLVCLQEKRVFNWKATDGE